MLKPKGLKKKDFLCLEKNRMSASAFSGELMKKKN